MSKHPSIDFLLNAAMGQDSLLQSYRSFHLFLQSIFVAVATGLVVAILSLATYAQALAALAVLLAISILSIYLLIKLYGIIIARGEDVNYWHRQIIRSEQTTPSEERFFTKFKVHQKLRRDNAEYLNKFLASTSAISDGDIDYLIAKGLGHTRTILDKWLYRGLLIIWSFILFLACGYVLLHFQYRIL